MKKEIICMECKKKTRKLYPTDTPYPGEHVKFLVGKALDDFRCDQCNKDIFIDERCCAFSIWADYGGQPYHNWEKEFVEAQIFEEEPTT